MAALCKGSVCVCQPALAVDVREVAVPGLEPLVAQLVAAAECRVGLNVLLLFGRDPLIHDTALGFATRLRCQLDEVRETLDSLKEHEVLCTSDGPRDASQVSYWLSEDPCLPRGLHRLVATYDAGQAQRRDLLRALASH